MSRSKAVRLTNGIIDVVVAVDRGPRVLRYGYVESENLFADAADLATRTSLGEWRPWGGHRLWVAPEMMPGSYAPDTAPVEHEVVGTLNGVFQQTTDSAGIEKRLALAVSPPTRASS